MYMKTIKLSSKKTAQIVEITPKPVQPIKDPTPPSQYKKVIKVAKSYDKSYF